MDKYWGRLKKCVSVHPDHIIIFGGVLILVGIGMSFYTTFQKESIFGSDTKTLLSSFIILAGTFVLGWGFYLKGRGNRNQKLSDYGQFMLGLATLITLPQAPEMLKHILKIETAVTKLQNLQEVQDGMVKFRSSTLIRTAKTPTEIEDIIRSLTRTENAQPYMSSEKKSEKALHEPRAEPLSSTALPSPPSSMDQFTSELRVAPTPGMAYLTRENADKIIATLKQKGFDKSTAEALVQENLEVCHPMDISSKCAK